MRVLSIDLDYFISVTDKFRTLCFPDCNEFVNPVMDKMIWSGHYYNKELFNVKIKSIKFNYILKILKYNSSIGVPVYLSVSHVGIISCLKHKNIYLNNIDFHHDMWPLKKEINCGNWLTHLVKEKRIKEANWIVDNNKNKMEFIHDLDFGLPIKTFKEFMKFDKEYDLIFICFSCPWVPPHLDKVFIEKLSKIIEVNFKDRYDNDFQKLISFKNEAMEEMMKSNKGQFIL